MFSMPKALTNQDTFQTLPIEVLIRKFLNSESTVLFLDDMSLYRTCILLFSITISATAAFKAKNIIGAPPSMFHKTHQLNTQSSG